MIAVAPSDIRNALRSNRWSSTGTVGVRSMMASNVRRRDQIVPILHPTGCPIARIGTLGIARRPAPWCGSSTIITSRALQSP